MRIKVGLRIMEITRLREAITKYADEQLEQARIQLHDYDSPKGTLRHVVDLYELRDVIATDLAKMEKEGRTKDPTSTGFTTVDPKLVLEVIAKSSDDIEPGWDYVLYQLVKVLTTEGRRDA